MRAWLGVSLGIAAALFLLPVETAWPGAPDVCEEPCVAETEGTEAALPGDPRPAPVPELSDPVGAEPATGAAGPPAGPRAEVERARAPGSVDLRLLPVRLRVPAPRGGIPVARGAMGYRVPLVVKQRVPDQIHGGVYMLAHDTYVILRPGHWELAGAAEGSAVEEAAAVSETETAPEVEKRGWLRRLFRKKGRDCDGGS